MAIKKKKRIVIAIVVALICVSGFGIKKIFFNKTIAPLEVYEVTKKDIDFSYSVTGYVESQKTVSVFSNNATEVDKVNVRLNDTVNQGDVLLTFKKNSSDTQALNIQKANSIIPKLKSDYESAKKIYAVGGISRSDLENARQALNSAIIDSKIAANGYKPFERVLKSPISGVIVESNADDNYKIDPTKPLYKIADTTNLKITLEIPNYKAKNLLVGQQVNITSDSLKDGELLTGSIKSISKISTKSSITNDYVTTVEVSLSNYSTLKPGVSVDAKIIYSSLKNKLFIPIQYIQFENNENNKPYTYVINNKGILEKRSLKLGKSDTLNYEVLSGLHEHEKLLNNSNHLYKEGEKIND